MERYRAVSRVLVRVLVLNLGVAIAKIALGSASGAVSILSDGFHSLTDTASNVVAIIGVRVASRPPDEDHPYGHRKFETLASIGILVFLVLVLVQVLRAAVVRLRSGEVPQIEAVAFWVMGSTFLVNAGVVWYERRAGRRLQSEVLLADAHHTTSDLLTSAAVVGALIGVRLGHTWLDPAAAIVVAGFIAVACWEIFQDTARILGDRVVIDEGTIRDVVHTVPEALGCHHIRTRGSTDFVFLDLHVWVDGNLPLFEAHRLSHVVKDRLMARFPQIKDAVIHIEPPPENRAIDE
ncbi:MAG: cation diffusion facilitator family transporter [Acidobacteriota bacterium]|nr:cation diffusion facilitator family transporter [Acidobacteriota bacterium]